MFTAEAISQALSLWLGTAAIGLIFALIIAFLSQRGRDNHHSDTEGSHGHSEDRH